MNTLINLSSRNIKYDIEVWFDIEENVHQFVIIFFTNKRRDKTYISRNGKVLTFNSSEEAENEILNLITENVDACK